ncbi:MAG: hypothetical protein ABI760_18995 [Ferruginibacter sp.]
MIIEIPKNTPEDKIIRMLKGRQGKKLTPKALSSFFGKLPHIEDGMTYQKKIRNEWK